MKAEMCRWGLNRLRAELSPVSKHPARFSSHKSCESGNIFLKLSRDLTLVTWSNGPLDLRVGTSHDKSGPCLVSYPRGLQWRYNAFNLSRDFTRLPHWGVRRIYGWELLVVYQHPDQSYDHKHWDNRDIVFLICQVTCREHIFKGQCESIGGNPLRRVATLPYLVAIDLVQAEI